MSSAATLTRSTPSGNGTSRAVTFARTRGAVKRAARVLVYGTGGAGKTSLAAARPGTLFIDLEGGTAGLDVDRVEGVATWEDLLTFLRTGDFSGISAICIDTVTRAEDFLREHVIATVKTEKGASVTSIEGYGFGKGYVFIAERWKVLLATLDAHHIANGRDVILVAHERTGKVPNPKGDDYIRYEPRLQNTDKASIMNMTKEWADHVAFVAYDLAVTTGGRAIGSGTRTIYITEEATHVAKNRELGADPIPYAKGDSTFWSLMNKTPSQSTSAPSLD